MYKLLFTKRIYHDIEVAENFFCDAVEDHEGNSHIFMVNPFTGQNDLVHMKFFYGHITRQKIEVVSGNGKHYDSPVLMFIFDNIDTWIKNGLSCLQMCLEIKIFSNLIFFAREWWKIEPKYWNYRSAPWIEVDIFCFWSPMTRETKGISVKKLGIQTNFPVVQELPFDPHLPVREENIPLILKYCLKYDVGILKHLFSISFNWQGQKSSFEEMLDLRKEAVQIYGFGTECYSWDSVKLGVAVLTSSLSDKQKEKLINKSLNFTIKDITHPVIKFDDVDCNVNYDKKDESHVATCFKAMFDHLQPRKVTESISYRVHWGNAVYDVKTGGLHTRNKPIVFTANEKRNIESIDVASYYPTLGALFGSAISARIEQVKDERLALKAAGLGKKPKANLLKLGLNGGIGKTRQANSDIENPRFFYSITMNGQMMLLMLVEDLEKLPGVEVIMANTDGLELYVPPAQRESFLTICKAWEKKTSMELEYDQYSKIIVLNINNYLAIFPDGRKPKTKGIFVTEPDLGNSSDFLIIPKILQLYYVDGIPLQEGIKKILFDIMDYCGCQKVDRTYKVVLGQTELPQRLNRYYVSKEGQAMFKTRNGKLYNFSKLKGAGICLYNNIYTDKVHPVDINFYINKANEIIGQIERRATTLFG